MTLRAKRRREQAQQKKCVVLLGCRRFGDDVRADNGAAEDGLILRRDVALPARRQWRQRPQAVTKTDRIVAAANCLLFYNHNSFVEAERLEKLRYKPIRRRRIGLHPIVDIGLPRIGVRERGG